MSCSIYSYDLITAYFDGELSPEESREMDSHVSRCPECSPMLRELKLFRDLMAGAGAEEMEAPPDLKDSVLCALRAEGAFKKSGKSGFLSGQRWNSLARRGAAAAVGALLVGGATWGWFAGGIGSQIPRLAQKENPSSITENYTPENIKPSDNNAPTVKDPSVETTVSPTENRTVPPETPSNDSGSTPEAVTPAKPQMIAQGASGPSLSATFLSLNKVSYSGFLQVSANGHDLLKPVKVLAEKYGASVSGPDSGTGKIIRVNVSTTSYGALFEELKGMLAGNGLLQNSGSTSEDYGKVYRETLIELEQVLKQKDELSAGQFEELSRLEQKESALQKKLQEMDARARSSTIVIKF